MTYLVDTNVISAAAPAKTHFPELVRWLDERSDTLFLSAVTIAEIEAGIAKLRRSGGKERASRLSEWLDTVLHLYGERVLVIDAETGRTAGSISDAALASGHVVDTADLFIAATAVRHGLTLLTRNVRHFAPTRVPTIDPFLEGALDALR